MTVRNGTMNAVVMCRLCTSEFAAETTQQAQIDRRVHIQRVHLNGRKEKGLGAYL